MVLWYCAVSWVISNGLEESTASIDTAHWMELNVGKTTNHMHVTISAALVSPTFNNKPTDKSSLKAKINDWYIM